ncbi:DUF692 domain-containing protein [Tumebacillus permanentifrigoris]|uniref:DUF692 domain-containing protein n=1 Tax=Tumebacillus permanentifrigoris TaxID=378543 RepID=A0A316D287_9BACL|nr:DUF692 family multinuclear iron-containing protein [Tumebacillus permanentifrigoris]PWK03922.1 hypothetical protein C7459_1463 [Tumebacillus permanentifrigoris]
MARGVGIGYRSQFTNTPELLLQHVDFLEYNQRPNLEAVQADLGPFLGKLPVVIHSINLSLGSVEPPAEQRVEALKRTADFVNASWVSEHLSYSRVGDIEIENFIALPYTDEAIEVASKHILDLQNFLGRPMIMENVTHHITWPVKQYSEAEFIKRVMLSADCGLLLDVTNLYLNSVVHKYDPIEYLKTIPRDRVVQLHLAGHTETDGELVDSHVGGIDPKVMELTEWVMDNTSCDAMIIERDNQLETFNDVLEDVALCRSVYQKYRGAMER